MCGCVVCGCVCVDVKHCVWICVCMMCVCVCGMCVCEVCVWNLCVRVFVDVRVCVWM